jgi:hypothetical protein
MAQENDDPTDLPDPRTPPPVDDEAQRERADRGLSDFVRRAVTAGFEVASRGKEDFVRVATTEVRSWLDKLELDTEIVKALSRMTIEVKAEFRFRPTPDGKLVPEPVSSGEVKVKGAPGKG